MKAETSGVDHLGVPGRPMAEARLVTRRFGSLVAVDAATLQVGAGEVVGLLGANGAGKTTLIRMILGLLPATSGTIRLFGKGPSRNTRREIGYVPQGLGLWEDLTVEENLAFTAAAFGVGVPRLDADLARVRAELVGDLPLGLQRRVAFAAALSHDPRLLILDEPTSGVDTLARARLWDTIRNTAEAGAGALVTTHNMEEAEQCDRLVVMVAGRIATEGTMAEILGDATAVEVRTADWERAFEMLDDEDFLCLLKGRTIRLADAEPEDVKDLLGSRGVEANVSVVAATFEERFVSLASVATVNRRRRGSRQ